MATINCQLGMRGNNIMCLCVFVCVRTQWVSRCQCVEASLLEAIIVCVCVCVLDVPAVPCSMAGLWCLLSGER